MLFLRPTDKFHDFLHETEERISLYFPATSRRIYDFSLRPIGEFSDFFHATEEWISRLSSRPTHEFCDCIFETDWRISRYLSWKPETNFCNIFLQPIDELGNFSLQATNEFGEFFSCRRRMNFEIFSRDRLMNLANFCDRLTNFVIFLMKPKSGFRFFFLMIDWIILRFFLRIPQTNFSIFSYDRLTNFPSPIDLTYCALSTLRQNNEIRDNFLATEWRNLGFFSRNGLSNYAIFSWQFGKLSLFILRQIDQIRFFFIFWLKNFAIFARNRLTNFKIFYMRPIDKFRDIFLVTIWRIFPRPNDGIYDFPPVTEGRISWIFSATNY